MANDRKPDPLARRDVLVKSSGPTTRLLTRPLLPTAPFVVKPNQDHAS